MAGTGSGDDATEMLLRHALEVLKEAARTRTHNSMDRLMQRSTTASNQWLSGKHRPNMMSCISILQTFGKNGDFEYAEKMREWIFLTIYEAHQAFLAKVRTEGMSTALSLVGKRKAWGYAYRAKPPLSVVTAMAVLTALGIPIQEEPKRGVS